MPDSRVGHRLPSRMLIALGTLIAGLMGSCASAAPPDDAAAESIRDFTRVFTAVEANFPDTGIGPKALYKGAIPGMLRTLDPHSRFFDPDASVEMHENQSGRYVGVGLSSNLSSGRPVVVLPFDGSPAQKAGIRPGDTLIKINGKNTKNLSTAEVSALLRGPRGTRVEVEVARPGYDRPFSRILMREEIPRPTVPVAFYLKPGVAYLQITSFGETTGEELEDNLRRLHEKEITGLILDLRGNPGGLLNEAVKVASHFLARGQLIVSHEGRSSPRRSFSAPRDGSGKDYPIVLLVDSGTASAAEIVTGALQDHDRGWILGQPTYGKGLVQSSFSLSQKTTLWLTTAQYFTPSGRLIQRDYSKISFLDYTVGPRLEYRNLGDTRQTDGGRTVYGGGGITPDERFEFPRLDRFQAELHDHLRAFFEYSAHYFAGRDAKLPPNWQPDAEVASDFEHFVEAKWPTSRVSTAQFTAHRDWVSAELERELHAAAFGQADSLRVAARHDPAIAQAVDSLSNAISLQHSTQKILAEQNRTRRGIIP